MALRKAHLPSPLSLFEQRVARVVKAIPPGRTRSYAQVALLAGAPGAPRAVVRALKRLPGVPWWRVIRADGTIAPPMLPEQAAELRAEGAEVVGRRVVDTRDPLVRLEKALAAKSTARRAGDARVKKGGTGGVKQGAKTGAKERPAPPGRPR
jgi:methylated-DNA-protein-cysteine methyltransferase-like protein